MPDFREVTEFIKDTFGYIVVFAVMLFIFTFIIAIAPIAGNSMNPTLSDGDFVVVSKFSYLLSSIKRDDVVIFKDSEKKKYVKRVIGLPGESIDHLDGFLYINDEPYKETLLDAKKTNNFMFEDICSKEKCPDGVIPEGKYLVLGDNRIDSKDSRDPSIGLVDEEEIFGKILFRLWPFSDFGKVK